MIVLLGGIVIKTRIHWLQKISEARKPFNRPSILPSEDRGTQQAGLKQACKTAVCHPPAPGHTLQKTPRPRSLSTFSPDDFNDRRIELEDYALHRGEKVHFPKNKNVRLL